MQSVYAIERKINFCEYVRTCANIAQSRELYVARIDPAAAHLVLLAILRFSFFFPSLYSLLSFRYAPRARNRVETYRESGPME